MSVPYFIVMKIFNIIRTVSWQQYTLSPQPLSVAVTPIIQLQIEPKKHIMGDERMFERINIFIVTNKVPMTAVMFQNNPRNYVTSYETELYQLQHISV
jgi:hypothetical protein